VCTIIASGVEVALAIAVDERGTGAGASYTGMVCGIAERVAKKPAEKVADKLCEGAMHVIGIEDKLSEDDSSNGEGSRGNSGDANTRQDGDEQQQRGGGGWPPLETQ
jgi:hypothetical protein